MTYSVLSMFSGAGGVTSRVKGRLGLSILKAVELNRWAIDTLLKNRPSWNPVEADVHDWSPAVEEADVLIAGPPCQGFSLGGSRRAADDRNGLFRQVIRVAAQLRPRAIVIENVLNLRTMSDPESGRPFAVQIAHELAEIGYRVEFDVSRCVISVSRRHAGDSSLWHSATTRQTAIAFLRLMLLPPLGGPRGSRSGRGIGLPNHDPAWGFQSIVHPRLARGSILKKQCIRCVSRERRAMAIPYGTLMSPFQPIRQCNNLGLGSGQRAGTSRKRRIDSRASIFAIRMRLSPVAYPSESPSIVHSSRVRAIANLPR